MRKLQFKFLSQIRISGWDFGSSARAMNQAGGNFSTQADLRTVRKSTTERKSMSTKTSIKRIALVAVAALGLGMVSTVAANAVVATGQASIPSAGTTSPTRVGYANSTAISLSGGVTTGDTSTVRVTVIAAPTGSAFNSPASAASNASNASAFDSGMIATGNSIAAKIGYTDAGLGTITATGGAGTAGTATAGPADKTATVSTVYTFDSTEVGAGKSGTVYVNITPDIAGTYTVLVSTSATATTTSKYTAGDNSVQYSFTTAGAPTQISASYVGSVVDFGKYGALVSVKLKDANGNATVLGANEGLTVSTTATNVALRTKDSYVTVTAGTPNTYAYTNGSAVTAFGPAGSTGGIVAPSSSGTYRVRVLPNGAQSAGSVVISFVGSGMIPATTTSNLSVATVAAVASTATKLALNSSTGYYGATSPYDTTATSTKIDATITANADMPNEPASVVPGALNSASYAYDTYFAAATKTATTASFTVGNTSCID